MDSLREELLSEVIEVSRTVLGPVLRRLAHEGLVVILLCRGAHVSLPSAEEAREVFAAGRVIEAGLQEQCTSPLLCCIARRTAAVVVALPW